MADDLTLGAHLDVPWGRLLPKEAPPPATQMGRRFFMKGAAALPRWPQRRRCLGQSKRSRFQQLPRKFP